MWFSPKQSEIFIVHNHPAAGGEHLPVLLQDLHECALFQLAKKRLALLGKDFSHFLTFDFLDEPVEIDKTALQSLCEIPSWRFYQRP